MRPGLPSVLALVANSACWAAPEPRMIVDLDSDVTSGPAPAHFLRAGSGWAFTASTSSPSGARRVIFSDGTPAGTHVVVDALVDGLPDEDKRPAVVGDYLVYPGTGPAGAEPYAVRITPPHVVTRLVDAAPGSAGSAPRSFEAVLTPDGPRVRFRTTGGWWTTDGTPGGTGSIVMPLADAGLLGRSARTGELLLSGSVGFQQIGLWSTRGTSGTTNAYGALPWSGLVWRVADELPSRASPDRSYVVLEGLNGGVGVLEMGASPAPAWSLGLSGTHLLSYRWGTAGGEVIVRLYGGGESALYRVTNDATGRPDGFVLAAQPWLNGLRLHPSYATPAHGTLYGLAYTPRSDSPSSTELTAVRLTLDGAGHAAGVERVADFWPGGGDDLAGPVAFGGDVFVGADDGTGRRLWAIRPGQVERISGSIPAPVTPVAFEGTRLYFGARGNTLGVSDGTLAGTRAVKALNPGMAWSNIDPCFEHPNGVCFTATGAGVGNELFTSDGTEAGTVLLADLRHNDTASTSPIHFTDAGGGRALFVAASSSTLRPYLTDGTPEGTAAVSVPAGVFLQVAPHNKTIHTGGRTFIRTTVPQAVLEVVGGALVARTPSAATVRDVGSLPDGRLLVAGSIPGSGDGVYVLEPAGLRRIAPAVTAAGFFTATDGRTYFSASQSGTEAFRTDGQTVESLGDLQPAGAPAIRGWASKGGKVCFCHAVTGGNAVACVENGVVTSAGTFPTASYAQLFVIGDDFYLVTSQSSMTIWRVGASGLTSVATGAPCLRAVQLGDRILLVHDSSLGVFAGGRTAHLVSGINGATATVAVVGGVAVVGSANSGSTTSAWLTDGTGPGTSRVTYAGSTAVGYGFTAIGSRVYFAGKRPGPPDLGYEPTVMEFIPADHDNNGAADVLDIFGFLQDWFAGSPRADFDRQHGVGLPDIFAFLQAWFGA